MIKIMEEKIEEFDKKLEKYEDYNILMAKVIRYIIEGIWAVFMMIPIQEYDKEMIVIFLFGGFLSFFAVFMYLNVYINVRESENTTSIYKKLSYIPIDKKAIFCVRFRYLYHYCKVKLIVFWIFQIGITLITLKTISIWNILYPLLWVGITNVLMGIFIICPFFPGRKFFIWVFTDPFSLLKKSAK